MQQVIDRLLLERGRIVSNMNDCRKMIEDYQNLTHSREASLLAGQSLCRDYEEAIRVVEAVYGSGAPEIQDFEYILQSWPDRERVLRQDINLYETTIEKNRLCLLELEEEFDRKGSVIELLTRPTPQ